jgi:hypothetical protein
MTTSAPGAAILLDSNKSATVPAPTARHGAPATAANVLHTSNPAKVSLNPAPMMNSMYSGMLTLYTIALPRVSEIGAASIGPIARPSTKSESGRRAAVCETWNLCAMAKTPGVIIEEPAVTERQRRETGMMWHAFFTRVHVSSTAGMVVLLLIIRSLRGQDLRFWEMQHVGHLQALQFLGFSKLEGRSQSVSRDEGSEHSSLMVVSHDGLMEESESRTIWISISIDLPKSMLKIVCEEHPTEKLERE